MAGYFLDGIRMSVGTLSAIPVAAPRDINRRTARVAMTVAPLAVIPLAAVAGLLGYVAMLVGLPPLVAAVLVIGAVAWGSRGMHLDGLADSADGLSASWDRTRALEVMRRGDSGPMGVATLVIMLALQIACMAVVLSHPWGGLVAGVLICVSRGALLIACASGVPAARGDGLGATVAGVVPRPIAVGVWILGAVVVSAVFLLAGRRWWQGGLAALVGVIACCVWVFHCVRRFGGITGDVLGASIEITLAVMVVVAAAG
ncbi:cobalamin-5'-phosphate synthase [Antricoccus suffuscus]|uniref:Adenosylcobinamide-GDP ribazoletransferase n=1 Tax=Antricoccus suffuscus TaxID=1629062 RepID=A0A2T0ZZG2_9ACTN|nr:adenosylcobinamide-GDP ribazoletransferase [Antricoccus suffuscus]PRZ41745.1 cobalamin-5'-phosphate synthase [Antricoccus suffuscus]